MKIKLLSISTALFIAISTQASATEFVVDQKHHAANDTGQGTKKQPFKTIGAAVRRAKSGDKILIHAGIYREGVELKTTGTENNPVLIEAADPGKVIMRGSVVVSGWIHEPGGSPVYLHDGWISYFAPASPRETDGRGKPRNQLFSDGVLIEDVFQPGDLKQSSFYIDGVKKQIHLWLPKGEDPHKKVIEVSDREFLFDAGTNNYIVIRGMRFEHGANGPQGGRALVRVRGNNCLVENCSMSLAAATGFGLSGRNNIVRRCIFNNNGQQGFSVSFSADCLVQDCESSYNNNVPGKTFNINWEAGGNKIAFSYRLVIERHQAHYNNGDGLWFDISNNECEIKNCFCTNNKRSGIFWEISYAANIHDNVLIGNNSQGILLAESNGPVVERNMMIGNTNGLTFRDMIRTTSPAIDGGLTRSKEEAIWNHNEVIKNNVMAFNKNSQVRGAFLNKIERMVPSALQKKQDGSLRVDSMVLAAADYQAKDEQGQPLGLSLEKLNIKVDNNVYWTDTIPTLYQWPEMRYQTLEVVRKDLKFEENGSFANPEFADWKKFDLRVPEDSPLLKLGCYPRSEIPGVKLGIINK